MVAVSLVRWKAKNPVCRRVIIAVALFSTGFILAVKIGAPHLEHKRNMRAVYEMCKKYEMPDTRFFLVQTKAWGMQFYLKGQAVPLSATGEESWAAASVSTVIQSIMRGHFDELPVPKRNKMLRVKNEHQEIKKVVFIYKLWNLPDFPKLFVNMDNDLVCDSNKFWGVCMLDLDTIRNDVE